MIISSLCEGKRNETVVDETVVANMHPVLFLKLILVLQNINPFVLRMW
jgi:hypothetical protein